MPLCKVCGYLAATVEMRRSTKKDGSFLCKDKIDCKRRKKEQK